MFRLIAAMGIGLYMAATGTPTGSQRSSSRGPERIASLRKLEAELERIATCCTGETVGDCYVIRALSDHSLCGHEH